jgi:hypothetical protein
MNNIKAFCRQMIVKEYRQNLKDFLYNCKFVLKCNPHNQYKKSAWQYMKDFNIFQDIRQKTIKKWTI